MDSAQLTEHWANRVGTLKSGHYRAATKFEWKHIVVGIFLILFSALAATLTQLKSPEYTSLPYWSAIQAGVGLIATVLAGLQTFVRWSEKAEKHRSAGATYAKLELRLDSMLTFPQEDAKEAIDDLYDEWARLTGGSPAIPQGIYKKFCACMDRDPCEAHRAVKGSAPVAAPPPATPATQNPSPKTKYIEVPVAFSADRTALLRVPVDLKAAEAERAIAVLKASVSA